VQPLELVGDLGHRRLVEAVAHPGVEEVVAGHHATFSRRLSIVHVLLDGGEDRGAVLVRHALLH
jgi:hypothetical protein